MEEIILNLENWASYIEFDLKRGWHKDRTTAMLQLLKLEQAISLLKSVGDNNNIKK